MVGCPVLRHLHLELRVVDGQAYLRPPETGDL
jgi:hypothetical protein